MNTTILPHSKEPVHDVFHSVLIFTTVVDLIVQLYTAYVIWRVSTPKISQYRYFMLFSAFWDLGFSVAVGFVMQPRVFSPDFPCLSVRSLFLLLGDGAARVTYALAYFFGAGIICSQYYSLAYRSSLVMDGRWLRDNITQPCLVFPCVTACLLVPLAIGVAAYFTEVDYAQILVFRGLMASRNVLSAEDTGMFCVNTWEDTSIVLGLSVFTAFAVSELLCLACGAWIIRKVNRQPTFSAKTKAMHLQFTRLIIAQILSPVVSLLLPLTFFAGGSLLFGSHTAFVYVEVVFFTLFPLIDAVLTVGFVAPYRKFTWDLMRFKVAPVELDFGDSTHERNALRAASRQRGASMSVVST